MRKRAEASVRFCFQKSSTSSPMVITYSYIMRADHEGNMN